MNRNVISGNISMCYTGLRNKNFKERFYIIIKSWNLLLMNMQQTYSFLQGREQMVIEFSVTEIQIISKNECKEQKK